MHYKCIIILTYDVNNIYKLKIMTQNQVPPNIWNWQNSLQACWVWYVNKLCTQWTIMIMN